MELPTEPGIYFFWLKFNGEPAFEVSIENLADDDSDENPKDVVVSMLKMTTMPVLGGMGDEATVTLKLQGS